MLGLLESEKEMVKDYQIVVDRSRLLLEQEVRELIKRGWEPQGGMTCFSDWGVCQAMILKDKE